MCRMDLPGRKVLSLRFLHLLLRLSISLKDSTGSTSLFRLSVFPARQTILHFLPQVLLARRSRLRRSPMVPRTLNPDLDLSLASIFCLQYSKDPISLLSGPSPPHDLPPLILGMAQPRIIPLCHLLRATTT
jgi:hypothetical protein